MSAVSAQGLTLGTNLCDVTFDLPLGSCTAVLGPNGAGKSTLLGLLAGALVPDAGTRHCLGPVSYLPEGLPLESGLRVRDVLSLVQRLPGWEPRVADPLQTAFDLPLKNRTSALSQGQRVRLGVLLTLGRRARTYLLDDPFLGLDPMVQVVVERAIADRAAEATVVMACQHAAAAERLCDHLLFLRKGGLQWCAPLEAWRARFRRVRVRGNLEAIHELGELALHVERRGSLLEALLDDPAGVAEARMRVAGAVVEPLPLPLDELLLAVAA